MHAQLSGNAGADSIVSPINVAATSKPTNEDAGVTDIERINAAAGDLNLKVADVLKYQSTDDFSSSE